MDPNQVQENNNTSTQGQAPQYLLKPSIEGLGGWLVLVQISIYFSLIAITIFTFNSVLPIFDPEIWNVFADQASPYYDSMFVPLIVFEIIMNAAFVILLGIALYLMYKKKSAFPRLMIGYILFSLLASVLDYVLVNQVEILVEEDNGQFIREIVRACLYACIWIPYFIRSKRVRNTFVN